MKVSLLIIFLLLLQGSLQSGEEVDANVVATFSIVAVDQQTGEIGVAVQSKIVGVGAVVPWARAGVGAIATQAWANVRYGPAGLMMMDIGSTPEQTIELLTRDDPMKAQRQIGIVSAEGKAATFTGEECNEWAGGLTGDGYAVQGNILTGEAVVKAMAKAYEKTEGVLAARLLAALEAGQSAGGDKRGKQSAGLLIVREGWGYGRLNDRFRDIRVDEHEEPIKELRRVFEKHREMFRRPDGRDQPTPEPEKKPKSKKASGKKEPDSN